MIWSLARGAAIGSLAMILAAFCGAMLSMGAILLVSTRVKSMSLLIVCGVMIGYICSAVTDIVVTFANDSNIVNLHNWSMGSFSGIDWPGVRTAAIVVLAAMVCAFLLSKPMGAYQLGESYARSMGVNIRRFRVELIRGAQRLRDGLRRTDLLRGHRGAPSDENPVPHGEADPDGSGLFPRRRGILPALRSHRPESLRAAVFGVPVVIWMLLARQKRKEEP